MVRSYRRMFETVGEPIPSFSWAVVTQYREGEDHAGATATDHDTHDLILNFSGDRYSFPSSALNKSWSLAIVKDGRRTVRSMARSFWSADSIDRREMNM